VGAAGFQKEKKTNQTESASFEAKDMKAKIIKWCPQSTQTGPVTFFWALIKWQSALYGLGCIFRKSH